MPVARALQRKYPLIHTFPAYSPEQGPDQPLRIGSPEFYIFDLGAGSGTTQPAAGR
jgi:hypothetical protein